MSHGIEFIPYPPCYCRGGVRGGDLFVKCIKDANELVFDNGRDCKAYHQDALSLLLRVEVDLVYTDPPYMTRFGFNDYEDKMHFVEGLMTYYEVESSLCFALSSWDGVRRVRSPFV